jgi:hypothetical protein
MDGFGVNDAFAHKGKVLILCWNPLNLSGWYAPCLVCALSEALPAGVHFMIKTRVGWALSELRYINNAMERSL